MLTKQFTRAAGLFVFGVVLASCSNNQSAFFETRDAQLSQGYSWQKLTRCRPPQQGSQALPVITSDGRRVVCYTLSPSEKPPAGADQSSTPSTASNYRVNNTPPVAMDSGTNAPGVSWKFTNF
jgi:hypothetical protein